MTPAVTLHDLGKQYRYYDANRPVKLKEAILKRFYKIRHQKALWALRHIDFQIPAGLMVGVIGANGAGKSTLLRMIGCVGQPDEGRVTSRGNVVGCLELGAGFHPELSGRRNIYLNGIIAGLTRRQVEEKMASIIEFAELGPYIDNPLRTYSSGMTLRLGFAVIAATSPDILLVDEVLAVGDRTFQKKCLDRIAMFKARGCTIIFASHDLDTVRKVCDRTLWLEKGQIKSFGTTDAVVDQYMGQKETG